MLEDLTFLENRGFAERNEEIRYIAEELRSSNDHLEAIKDYVSQLDTDESNKLSEFRRRTAAEIVGSGYVNGCTERALVFIALARELGIPTKYVETFDQEWLSNPNTNQIFGHVFVDVLVDGIWKAYDLGKGFTPNNEYIIYGKKYIEIGKGLDFSEVFIRENEGYRTEPSNLQTLDEVIRTFSPSISSK